MAKIALTGGDAVALAMKQINPDVVAAYPITPQTVIMEKFAEYVADGAVDTVLITVESEHSALSACVGASAAGARVMTATASQGLALMWEILYIASSLRLPIVMPVVTRALSAPINIHCDHSDIMGTRDAGWIILFSKNVQEAYDNTIQAVRIAEHPDVSLPVMVGLDGFITSHAMETLEVLDDDAVKKFIGEKRNPKYSLLATEEPITIGPLALPDSYFEFKRQQVEAMENALRVIEEVGKEYEKLTGRSYGFFDAYNVEDADYVVISVGSTADSITEVVDELRKEGKKVGSIGIRVLRPFNVKLLLELLAGKKGVAILDRSVSFGAHASGAGPIFMEVRSALYDFEERPKIVTNYIYGLGGRDILPEHIKHVFNELERFYSEGKAPAVAGYLGLRE
ncbi:MAG: pyruvate ferredoxin oxidoreductase [Thermoplasmata archaeon]|nr:pyruvate ferredoxin oxidoreductase [Euryarchaeota archaeon]RLF64768.1 MAG: pyruvate ferredoxin oxidoreductase [Thermoplasmata archaeon]